MSSIAISSQSAEKILGQLREMQQEATKLAAGGAEKSDGGQSFAEHLKESINTVNAKAVQADDMAVNLASGKSGNIHETMLAATQAELSFNLMVQIRNKALEAYADVMRMPV